MPKISMGGLDELTDKLREVGDHFEGIVKASVYPGAGIIADAIKAAAPVRTGDMRDSLSIHKMKNEDGFIYTTITFSGKDRAGHPNTVKARVNERRKPFISPVLKTLKNRATNVMEQELRERIRKEMEK